ncbi:MAG: hypothetical protein ACRD6X_19395 [Pyrinomonadaceae bacterium]
MVPGSEHEHCTYINIGGGGGGPIDTGDQGGGGNGGGNGNAANNNGNNDKKNSCQRFVDAVKKLLAKFPNAMATQVANLLYDRFANSGSEFGSDGFRPEFQDFSSGSGNQARHYVGGFWAGFSLGTTLGLAGANAREDKDRIIYTPTNIGGIVVPIPTGMAPETQSQIADKALNAVSAKHGGDFLNGKVRADDIPNLIREEVCAK